MKITLAFNSNSRSAISNHLILIRPLLKPRSGWDKAFRKLAENGDDMLIDAGEPKNAWPVFTGFITDASISKVMYPGAAAVKRLRLADRDLASAFINGRG